jgi:ABC-2 type transport system ATP-binding protein
MLLRLFEQPRLLLEDSQWLDVRGHVPRNAKVWRLADEVTGDSASEFAGLQNQDLASGRMAADVPDAHARENLGVAVQKLHDLVAIGERSEVVDYITSRATHIGVQGEVPLRALDEMTGVRERELELAHLVAPCQAAGVIPVKVGRDHGIDLIGANAQALQMMKDVLRLAQCHLPRPFFAQLVADPGLADDHPTVDARDEADARAVDHVVRVGRLLLLPQDLRHDAEHQAPVGFPVVGHQQVKLEVAQLHCAYMLPEMAAPAIRTSRLTKDYGVGRGLFDLDLQVSAQEVFGYLGPNGSGKTTTIRLLMGMIRPSQGTAHVFGLDCFRESVEAKRKVGYLPGDVPQFGSLRGSEVVAYLGGMRGGVDRRRVRALAERFDLDLSRRFREYSSGNKQKLAIVLAFMHEPELLILDEPTSSLDPLNQQEFYALLRETRDGGATVFLSSHVLSEVEHVCDRVGIIRDGRLVRLAQLEELRRIRVHRVEIEFAPDTPVPEVELRRAEGVAEVTVTGQRATCTVRGSFEALMRAIRDAQVVDFVSTEPSLEEIFLSYFSERKPKALTP